MSANEDYKNTNPPTITYTRKRTTTKTRTAASSARRRTNLPLCRASGGGEDDAGGKDQHSWFARKSAMFTDSQIKSHLVSGGAASKSDGVSFIGDVIVGANEERKKSKHRSGPRFAWEEEEEDVESSDIYGGMQRMTTAPTLMDIMDEKDKIDLMSDLRVNKDFDASNNGPKNAGASKKRSQNAALAQIAMLSGTGAVSAPVDGNSSIGWNLLRVWGYRSRLGVALVPLQGFDKSVKCIDALDESATHEAKWLASKRLRAVHLPSIENNYADDQESKCKGVDIGVDTKKNKAKVLVIPPPKTNRHGIGYDPFKNAPEFKAFHEQRKRMAQKHGKADGGDSGGRKKQRYFTDDLGKDARRRPWEAGVHSAEKDDFDDDSDDNPQVDQNRNSHYAVDRNYQEFIGSKASSGFALEDEDDANVYDGDQNFPQRDKQDMDGETSNYATEVQSPVASDEEDNGLDSNLFGNLAKCKTNSKFKSSTEEAAGDGKNLADAWSVWGFGVGDSSTGDKSTQIPLTQDGKPPLTGFVLSRKFPESTNQQNDLNASKRWRGPTVPSGYVLKRHVFKGEQVTVATSGERLDRTDCGLGLDLQPRPSQHKKPTRSMPPKVLPMETDRAAAPSQKLLAKDGIALNFHAVRESMKNRFVSGTSSTAEDTKEAATNDEDDDKEKEEWIDVTISTWMPARLLCKRWGVPLPTEYGEASGASAGVKRQGEEEYFRSTIYDPAVASMRDKEASTENLKDTKKPPASSNNKPDVPSVFAVTDDAPIEVDDSAAPTRPSESIFQSIFDIVESDMDISDEEAAEGETDALDAVITPQQASEAVAVAEETEPSEANELDVHGRARKRRLQMARESGDAEAKTTVHDSTIPTPDARLRSDDDKLPHQPNRPSSTPSSDDSSSSSASEHRRKHKRRHRRERHRRRESRSDSSDDSKRRRKHKHRSRSGHKEKKRKKDRRK